MKEKHKLLIIQICGVVLKAILSIFEKLEKQEEIDKSVLDQEIPLSNVK